MTAEAASTRLWVDLVRRTPMSTTRKLVALLVASYADGDGSRVYPGVPRLVVESGLSDRTVRRHLGWLREHGLLAVIRRGGRGRNATWQLVLAEQAAALDPPSPDQHRAAVVQLAAATRRRPQPVDKPVENPSDGAVAAPASSVIWVTDDGAISGQTALPKLHPPTPPLYLAQELPSIPSEDDLRTKVTATREEKAPQQDSGRHAMLTVIEGDARTPGGAQRGLWPHAVKESDVNAEQAKAEIRRVLAGKGRAPMAPYGVAPGANRRAGDRPAPEPQATPDAATSRPIGGLGFCVTCYAERHQAVLATDPVSGSACKLHQPSEVATG